MNRIILFYVETPLSKEWSLFRRGNYTGVIVIIKRNNTLVTKGYDILTGTPLPPGSYPIREANCYDTDVDLTGFIMSESRTIDYDKLAKFLIAGTSIVTGMDRLNRCFNDPTVGALHLTPKAGTPCLSPPFLANLELHDPEVRFDPVELYRCSFQTFSKMSQVKPQSPSVENLRHALERIPLPILRLFRIDRCYNKIAQETSNELLPMLTSDVMEVYSIIEQVHPELANALEHQLDLFRDH